MNNLKFVLICISLLFKLVLIRAQSVPTRPTPINEFLDLQIHPTMHVPYGFFGKGLTYFDTKNTPKLSYKHLLKNVNYANYLRQNKGARIIINGALNKEGVRRKKKARRVILEQINYINRFAAAHPEDFVVAKTPQEVRDLVANSQKTILIHSIEGGRKLVNSQADADFWAAQGVAYITLIHLVDYKNGAAAILPSLPTRLINWRAAFRRKKKRRLTEAGKNAIQWLANAGVMTDLTHMNDQTRQDALDFMQAQNIPPIVTHDLFKPIQNHPRGLSEANVLQVYDNQGFVSLPISGYSLLPYRANPEIRQKMDSLKKAGCYCEGSIDDYKFTYQTLQAFVQNQPAVLAKGGWHQLSEEEKIGFSIGFQSDFNGWLNHSRPRYGDKGCSPVLPDKQYEPIEIEGMPHPGLLESQWRLLEKEGVDIQPIRRNSEHFLRLWEGFLERSKK